MNETTPEAANLDFEGLAQAARLVASVSIGPARRPAPPPPPTTAAPAIASSPDAASLRAWEAAAEELEADWATPVDDAAPSEPSIKTTDTAPSAAAEEPMAQAESEESDSETGELGDSDTGELAEAEVAALVKASIPDGDGESALDALAKSVEKSALEKPAARPLPGRSLPVPPVPTRTPLPLPPPPAPIASRPPAKPLPPPAPIASRPPAKPLPPPSRTPLPPLVPPPAPSSQRVSPPPSAPTLPALTAPPRVAAPSLVEIRHSPVARRYYAQLGVAAVCGALLTIVLFALTRRSETPAPTPAATTTAIAKPAPEPAPAVPAAAAPKAAEPDSIPQPPVANLSVDDLAREAPKPASTGKAPASTEKAPAAPATNPAPAAAPAIAAPAPVASATADPTSKGMLQISSVPPANITIDGRPVGMTPKTVRLSPGIHRVALIGPEGRRSQTVNVTAGRTTSVAVSF